MGRNKRGRSPGLYPSIFSSASKPPLHQEDVKDEEGKQIVYNTANKRLCTCTVLYHTLFFSAPVALREKGDC